MADAAFKKEPIHDAWQVENDISATYESSSDDPQILSDMKMNIMLSGGIANGVVNTTYNMFGNMSQEKISSSLDISSYAPGVYFLYIIEHNHQIINQ